MAAANTSYTIDSADEGVRLDKWLAAATRLGSRRRALDALQRGRVFVDDQERGAGDAGTRLTAGMTVRLWIDRPGSAVRRGARRMHGLDIVFEDDVLIAIDKPYGLLTVPHPGDETLPSAWDRVSRHWRSHHVPEPLVVHRIDRDTSGLVLFARTEAAWAELKEQFRRREPVRRYIVFVHGALHRAQGTWRSFLSWDDETHLQRISQANDPQARESITHYRVRERYPGACLLDVELETGRQHQIRAQAMAHGHPLIGERLYVGSRSLITGPDHGRQALHAAELILRHPVTGRSLALSAPLTGDLQRLRARLRESAAGEPESGSSKPGSQPRA